MNGKPTVVRSLPDDAVLHAYVDGELDPVERSEVEAWLAVNPEMRMRVEAWREQTLAVHRLAGRDRLSPMPPEMARAAARLQTLSRRRRWFRLDMRIAAAVALTVAAGFAAIVGLQAYEAPSDDAILAFTRQAADAHRDYAALADLVTGAASGTTPIVSRMAGIAAQPPDLSSAGFKIVMHRILPRSDGSAAQILYANKDGKRVTLYIGPSQEGGGRQFTFRQDGGVSLLYWQSDEVAFSLIGRLDESALLELARNTSAAIDGSVTPGGPAIGEASGAKGTDKVISIGAPGETAAEKPAPALAEEAASPPPSPESAAGANAEPEPAPSSQEGESAPGEPQET